MDNNKDIVYFELDNWFRGRDYPPGEPFDSWIRTHQLSNDDWCKENKICVRYGMIDMSDNYIVTATREWVEKNCPQLLSDESYTYRIFTYYKGKTIIKEYTKKYSDFLSYPCDPKYPDEVYSKLDSWPFLEYEEDNFGAHFYQQPYDIDDEEEEDIEDE